MKNKVKQLAWNNNLHRIIFFTILLLFAKTVHKTRLISIMARYYRNMMTDSETTIERNL